MPTIERSPGVVTAGGLVAGGGRTGATDALNDVVDTAAQALRDHFQSDVTIRFNSDRRSGGAWLRTSEEDAIGRNAHVGINAGLDADSGEVTVWARVSPLADGADGTGARVDSIEEAIAFIAEHCPFTAAELVERESIATAAWRDAHLRRAMVTSALHDGKRVALIVFAAADDSATMLSIRRSRAANAAHFPSYALDAPVTVKDGIVMPQGLGLSRISRTPWRTGHDVREGVLYRVFENGSVDEVGAALARKGGKR